MVFSKESALHVPIALNNLRTFAIYIWKTPKALFIYWHRLIRVSLDIGVDSYVDDESRRTSSVEECHCPKAYRGLSCEQCAEGHYRLPSGFCVPCQCSGHAAQCDVNTGICLVSTAHFVPYYYAVFSIEIWVCLPGYSN